MNCLLILSLAILGASAGPCCNTDNNYSNNGNACCAPAVPGKNVCTQTTVVQNPTRAIPSCLPHASVSQSCHYMKTVVRPQIRNEVISVPEVDQIVRVVPSSVLEVSTVNCAPDAKCASVPTCANGCGCGACNGVVGGCGACNGVVGGCGACNGVVGGCGACNGVVGGCGAYNGFGGCGLYNGFGGCGVYNGFGGYGVYNGFGGCGACNGFGGCGVCNGFGGCGACNGIVGGCGGYNGVVGGCAC